MNSELTTIDLNTLDLVTGAGGSWWSSLIGGANVNKLVDSIGQGVGRVVGCGFGANGRREFGNCILTGHLGQVPK